MFNYLTAPNIRHKVKHPLFLSVKFSNAFKVLVNTKSQYFEHKELTVNFFIYLVKQCDKSISEETYQISWYCEKEKTVPINRLKIIYNFNGVLFYGN